MRSEKLSQVEGKITTADGTVTEFMIDNEGGWHQWGGTTEDLGSTVGAVADMAQALGEHLGYDEGESDED